MKKIFLMGALLLCLGVNNQAQLLWSDEFNGTSVNTGIWTFETGAGGWGNNELQYYRSQNASVSGGILTITAKKENYGGAAYTSARLKTQGKYSKQYGFIQARLKCPMGQGLWPAFWMLGANIGSVGWPACGEIDIMEHVNSENRVYGTIHWNGPSGYAYYSGNKTTTPASWHDYQVNWNNYGLKWYVDGVQYHAANTENNINSTEEFHRPFFFLLNFAVGGNWPGSPNASTVFPAYYQIDYVRVYQQSAAKSAQISDTEVADAGMYPNPLTSGMLTLKVANYNPESPVMVSFIDMSGKVVLRKSASASSLQIDAKGLLRSGMYNVVVENGTSRTTQKLVIK